VKFEPNRVKKFLLVGGSAAIVNLGVMSLLVELLGFKGYYLRNLANILSIEISVLFAFVLNRQWTWKDAIKKRGQKLIGQFIIYNSAVLIGILLRIALFAILELTGLFYLLNVSLGIGAAAIVDYMLYDKVVFKKRAIYAQSSIEE
jgi:dolichol-phosphate mannosyltransferase